MVKSVECQSAGEEEIDGEMLDAGQEDPQRRRSRRREPLPLLKTIATRKQAQRAAAICRAKVKAGECSKLAEAPKVLEESEEVVERSSEGGEGGPLDPMHGEGTSDGSAQAFAVDRREVASLWRWLSAAARSTLAFFSVPPM